jgi:hypothetical protein
MCQAPNGIAHLIAHLKNPAGCTTKDPHQAYAEVWIENGELKCDIPLSSRLYCDVLTQGETYWELFRTEKIKIGLCLAAGVKMGIVW